MRSRTFGPTRLVAKHELSGVRSGRTLQRTNRLNRPVSGSTEAIAAASLSPKVGTLRLASSRSGRFGDRNGPACFRARVPQFFHQDRLVDVRRLAMIFNMRCNQSCMALSTSRSDWQLACNGMVMGAGNDSRCCQSVKKWRYHAATKRGAARFKATSVAFEAMISEEHRDAHSAPAALPIG